MLNDAEASAIANTGVISVRKWPFKVRNECYNVPFQFIEFLVSSRNTSADDKRSIMW